MIKKIDNKPSKYGKDFVKIKFNSDGNLHLNKLLKLHMLTIIVRSVFEEDGKFYPQVLFKWMLVRDIKMLQYERFDVLEEININELNKSKECMLCHYRHFYRYWF